MITHKQSLSLSLDPFLPPFHIQARIIIHFNCFDCEQEFDDLRTTQVFNKRGTVSFIQVLNATTVTGFWSSFCEYWRPPAFVTEANPLEFHQLQNQSKPCLVSLGSSSLSLYLSISLITIKSSKPISTKCQFSFCQECRLDVRCLVWWMMRQVGSDPPESRHQKRWLLDWLTHTKKTFLILSLPQAVFNRPYLISIVKKLETVWQKQHPRLKICCKSADWGSEFG